MKPFRWNLKKKEQLGRLLDGECSLKVFRYLNDKRMIFVGRSGENIFDYLSGL